MNSMAHLGHHKAFLGGGTIRSVEGSSGSGTVRRVGPRCWRSGRTEALIL